MPVKRAKLRAKRRTIGERRKSMVMIGNLIASQSRALVSFIFYS